MSEVQTSVDFSRIITVVKLFRFQTPMCMKTKQTKVWISDIYCVVRANGSRSECQMGRFCERQIIYNFKYYDIAPNIVPILPYLT